MKNRVNIVLTQNQDFAPEGVTVCHSMEETLETLKQYPKEDVFIIGGGMIYKAFLPWCEKAYITHVYHTFEADTYLPDLEAQEDWKMASAGEALPINRKVISRLWTMNSGSMKGSVNEISCNSR